MVAGWWCGCVGGVDAYMCACESVTWHAQLDMHAGARRKVVSAQQLAFCRIRGIRVVE